MKSIGRRSTWTKLLQAPEAQQFNLHHADCVCTPFGGCGCGRDGSPNPGKESVRSTVRETWEVTKTPPRVSLPSRGRHGTSVNIRVDVHKRLNRQRTKPLKIVTPTEDDTYNKT